MNLNPVVFEEQTKALALDRNIYSSFGDLLKVEKYIKINFPQFKDSNQILHTNFQNSSDILINLRDLIKERYSIEKSYISEELEKRLEKLEERREELVSENGKNLERIGKETEKIIEELGIMKNG